MSDLEQQLPDSCPRCGLPGMDGFYICGTAVAPDSPPTVHETQACDTIAAMRPVVEAAERFRFSGRHTSDGSRTRQSAEELCAAVDAMREASNG